MHLVAIHLAKRNKVRKARLLGVSGGMPPRKIFDFRPSEIVFGAVLG